MTKKNVVFVSQDSNDFGLFRLERHIRFTMIAQSIRRADYNLAFEINKIFELKFE